jgi:HSP20 family protein
MAHFITSYDRDFAGFGAVSALFRDMDRWLRESDTAQETSAGWPAIHARNEATGYELTVDVAGLTEKDVRLDVHRGVLTLSGERKLSVPDGFKSVRRERSAARFSRSVQLPEDVNPDTVEASMRDGVLSIRLPKRAGVEPKRIQISTH